MEIKLFGYRLSISKAITSAWDISPDDIEKLAKTLPGYNTEGASKKIVRIKAMREIGHKKYKIDVDIKTAKEFVERHWQK